MKTASLLGAETCGSGDRGDLTESKLGVWELNRISLLPRPPSLSLAFPLSETTGKPGQDGEGDLELPMEAVQHIGVHSHSLNGQIGGNAKDSSSQTLQRAALLPQLPLTVGVQSGPK